MSLRSSSMSSRRSGLWKGLIRISALGLKASWISFSVGSSVFACIFAASISGSSLVA